MVQGREEGRGGRERRERQRIEVREDKGGRRKEGKKRKPREDIREEEVGKGENERQEGEENIVFPSQRTTIFTSLFRRFHFAPSKALFSSN